MNDGVDRHTLSTGKLARFAAFLVRWNRPLFLFSFVLVVLAWPLSRQLTFDQSIESLYADDDPHLEDYRLSKQNFGGDEFVFVAYEDPELFLPDGETLDPDAAERLKKFSSDLSRIGGVNSQSTQNLADSLAPTRPIRFKLIGEITVPVPRAQALRMSEGIVVSEDRRATAIIMRLKPEAESPIPRSETLARIRRTTDEFQLATGLSTYIVGEPVQVHEMFRLVEDDGRVLFRVSLLLLAAVLFVMFRSVRWVLVPLLVVFASILWTEAGFVLSGLKLSMVTSMLNSLVTIIGIATVMHLTVQFRALRADHDRAESLCRSLARLSPAIFWTTATTAFGFISLIGSSISPVRSFGMMMAIATMLVLFAAAGFVPGGVLLGKIDADPKATPGETTLGRILSKISTTVERHPILLGTGFGGFVVFSALGVFRLRVETDFSRNFRAESSIVRSLDFVETRLGGAGNWEVNFPAPAKLTVEYLDRVRRLTKRLTSETLRDGQSQLTKVIAMTDAFDAIPPVPFLIATIEDRLELMRQMQPELVPSFFNPKQQRMRILLRARERVPSDVKLQLIEQVTRLAREEFPPSDSLDEPQATATGMYVLLSFLIESLMSDQWSSFAFSASGIVVMMSIAFRSVKIGLIALIPNLFPIVAVVGTMGWLDLPINIATAMIASVSMGLTIDSSIHYLSGYQAARNSGASISEAISRTHQDVGRALVFANIALLFGFSVLTLSHFIPLVYFGALVNVAMLGGLIGNLFLLPMLLRWTERPAGNPA